MNIVVCLKQTPDTEACVRVTEQGGISYGNAKLIISPYDEYALEAALRLKEQHGGEVTVITLGSGEAREALYAALAMGADYAVLIQSDDASAMDEWITANALDKVVRTLPYDIVMAGRASVDGASGQVGIRLAEALDIPSAGSALQLSVEADKAFVTHETDRGMETVELPLPALVTAQKGLNEPRYPAVSSILRAKKKPIRVIPFAELALCAPENTAQIREVEYRLPVRRQSGRMLKGTATEVAQELALILLRGGVGGQGGFA
jgi:electron transfer flavoprotein beta subunit